MSFPVEIPLGALRLHPHPVFEALAYALGFRLFLALRRRRGDPVADPNRWSVVAAAAVGAALGSKLLSWLDQPSQTLARWGEPGVLLGGKTLVGGLLGGLIAVEWVKRRIGETRSTGDLFVLPLCAGIAVGRVGCFLTGLADHTHGAATALPWGVDFGDGIARHPAQLYEMLWVAALAGWAATRVPARSGDLFRGFMLLYLAFRLGLEWLKPTPGEYLGLTGIQVASLAGLAYYARDAWRVLVSSSAPAAPAAQPIEDGRIA